MATELTSQQPVLIHGDTEQNRLLGDHHGHPVHSHGIPHGGVNHGVNHGGVTHGGVTHGGIPHTHVGAVPVTTAAVPVLVGAVPVVQAYAAPQQAGVVKQKHSPLKTLIALLLLALAAILIGLLAYQAQAFFGSYLAGGTNDNSTDTDTLGYAGPTNGYGNNNNNGNNGNTGPSGAGNNNGFYNGNGFNNGNNNNGNGFNGNGYDNNGYNNGNGYSNTNGYNGYGALGGNNVGDNVGFNGAGTGMFFFGILFAVLQAVTAITMWIHLAYYFPYLRHSSILGPLKVTAAVGFIAMGFACRHISLGANHNTSTTHYRVTHAIEAFIIINWFFVMLALILSLVSAKVYWDTENVEEHRITRRMTAGYTQFFLALILIGLVAAYFQMFTSRYLNITAAVEMLLVFAIMFAVLQAISGIAMIQQCGYNAPGQLPETVHSLLKVVLAFGVIAFGFACRTIFLTTHNYGNWSNNYNGNNGYGNNGNNFYNGNNNGNYNGNNGNYNGNNGNYNGNGNNGNNFLTASPHLIAIEAFVIINFIATLYFNYASSHGSLNWDNYNTTIGKRTKGMIFGILQIIFSIILFGMLAGLLQGLTGGDSGTVNSINSAGKYMVWFGLLFAVIEFFAGCTMLESGTKKLGGLNPSSVSVTNKVALALGALAFGFACRHINLYEKWGSSGSRLPLVHAIESFIIINFFLTWLIDILCVRGMVEW